MTLTITDADPPITLTIEKIAPAGLGSLVNIDSLSEDPQNARLHPVRNLAAIKASLTRHGQQKPIVCRDNVAVAGSGTLRAARELGWCYVWAVESGLANDAEAMAYAIADNRSGETAEWDTPQLLKQIDTLQAVGVPVEDLGWSAGELDRMLEGVVHVPDRVGTSDEPLDGSAPLEYKGYLVFELSMPHDHPAFQRIREELYKYAEVETLKYRVRRVL